jgi:glutathione-regulated potassium-efflux system ancillary protein KefC
VDVLWVGAAYLAGWLGTRVGLPPLVGYLVAGFALFAAGVRSDEGLRHLAELGVWLLLFTVGLKLRVQNLVRIEVIGVGGLHLIISSLLMLAVFGSLLGFGNGLYIAVGLAFSSTVLAIKLLEDRRELNSFHGRIAVGILILQDLVAIVLLAFAGAKQPSVWALGLLALPLLRPVALWLLTKSGHDELLLMFGLALALAGGGIAQVVGISPELGALMFGAVLAGHAQTTELSRVLWGLKEAFLVAFFLSIGLGGFPPLELLPWGAVMLLVLPVQGLLFFALFTRFGLRARTAFVTSLALSSYGEFALIVIAPLITTGRLEASWASLIGVIIAVSLAVAAPLNRVVHRLYTRFEPWLLRFERHSLHPDREPTKLGKARWLVVGMGRTGGAAYKSLEASGERVVGLDNDPEKLERHRAKGRRVLYGDAEDPELWDGLEIVNLHGVIVTAPDFEARVRTLEGLKRRGFSGKLATVSHHAEEEPVLERAGATLVFRPFAEAGERLAERALGSSG